MTEHDFVWLANPETGAPWRCPAGAVELWQARGWTPCPEPEPVDPALAEHVAAPAAPSAAPEIPAEPAKTARRAQDKE